MSSSSSRIMRVPCTHSRPRGAKGKLGGYIRLLEFQTTRYLQELYCSALHHNIPTCLICIFFLTLAVTRVSSFSNHSRKANERGTGSGATGFPALGIGKAGTSVAGNNCLLRAGPRKIRGFLDQVLKTDRQKP